MIKTFPSNRYQNNNYNAYPSYQRKPTNQHAAFGNPHPGWRHYNNKVDLNQETYSTYDDMSPFPQAQPYPNHRPDSSAVRLSRPGDIALQVRDFSLENHYQLLSLIRLGEKFDHRENETSGWLIHVSESWIITARKILTTSQVITRIATVLMSFRKTLNKEVVGMIKQKVLIFYLHISI